MMKCLKNINWKKTGLFAAGVAFGTAGIKVLSSKDAKKVYANCTAAAINEEREAKEQAAEFEDAASETEE